MNIMKNNNQIVRQLTPEEQKRIKHAKHRFMVLDQWVRTQKKYLNDLKIIKENIQKPLVDKNIITFEENKIIFCNLDALIILSEDLSTSLEIFIKQWKPKTVMISPMLLQIYPFFKIYLEYCNCYQKGQIIMNKLLSTESCKEIEKALPGGLDINSYLIKPVQRPPKYILLLRDYRAKMEPDHPDYKSLEEVIQKYDQVIKINNESMQKQGRQQKIITLQKLYSGLIERSRQFLRQFNGITIQQKLKIYVFTDLIMLTKYASRFEELFQIIQLDGTSFVDQEADGKYFQNKVFVCGKFQCCHIIFQSKYEAFNFCEFILEVIDKINQNQQNRQKILGIIDKKQEIKVNMTLNRKNPQQQYYQPEFKITIVGVEKRPISFVKNETVYIIKYQLNRNKQIFQYVYTRFSLLEELYANLNKYENHSLPSLTPKILEINIYDANKNKTKIIEFRTFLIIEFLNTLFRTPKLMGNPTAILQKLKINHNLFDYARKKGNHQKCCNQSQRHKKFPKSFDEYFNQRHKNIEYGNKQQFCMNKFVQSQENIKKFDKSLCNTLQKVIVYLDAHQGRIDYNFLQKQRKQTYIITVWYYDNLGEAQHLIKIDAMTTVNQIMTRLELDFNIKSLRDFSLFLNYMDISRMLDGDQIIFDIISQIQGQITQIRQTGFLDFFFSSCTTVKEAFLGKKSKLILKKYFFLNKDFQKLNREQNIAKYRLIIQQALYMIHQQTVKLKSEQLIKIVAYYLVLKQLEKDFSVDKAFSITKQNVSNSILKKFNLEASDKLSNDQIIQNTLKIIQNLKEQYKKQIQTLNLFVWKKIMEVVQTKANWYSNLFMVKNHYPKSVEGDLVDLIIGVNYKHIYLIPPKSEQPLKNYTFPLQEFQYRMTPFCISFLSNGSKFRFDGRLLYNLSKLIKRYQLYNQIFLNKRVQRMSSQQTDLKKMYF